MDPRQGFDQCSRVAAANQLDEKPHRESLFVVGHQPSSVREHTIGTRNLVCYETHSGGHSFVRSRRRGGQDDQAAAEHVKEQRKEAGSRKEQASETRSI